MKRAAPRSGLPAGPRSRPQEVAPCPVCGRAPDIGRCGPWPKKYGPAPWYAACFSMYPREHYMGAGGNSRSEAIDEWNERAAASAPAPEGAHLRCVAAPAEQAGEHIS